MDKVSPEMRSQIMRSVKSTQNKSTEVRFATALTDAGVSGWEVRPDIKYKPDFIFRMEKIAIFIDGCFWHGCQTCKNKKPATNSEYWTAKVLRNQKRDREASSYYEADGWLVYRFWEHDIKQNLASIIASVITSVTTRSNQIVTKSDTAREEN